MTTFQRALRRRMAAMKLGARDLATAIGCAEWSVVQWLDGQAMPGTTEMVALCAVLGCTTRKELLEER